MLRNSYNNKIRGKLMGRSVSLSTNICKHQCLRNTELLHFFVSFCFHICLQGLDGPLGKSKNRGEIIPSEE